MITKCSKHWANNFLNMANSLNLCLKIASCGCIVNNALYEFCTYCDTCQVTIHLNDAAQLLNVRQIVVSMQLTDISDSINDICKFYKLIVKNKSIKHLWINIYKHNVMFKLIVPHVVYFKNKLINRHHSGCYMYGARYYLGEKVTFIL